MATERIASIDRLRGLVLVFMALDHCRDFVAPQGSNPEDLETTTAAFFALRWVTHFCAPVFIFLAGSAARFAAEKRQDPRWVQRWLFSRGIWLLFLEVTWVNVSWFFALEQIHLGVLWAIGGSMVLLAASLALAVFPVAQGSLWTALFHPSWHELTSPDGLVLMNVYVVVPWFLVLAVGWAAAPLLRDTPLRTAAVGGFLLLIFFVVRALNGLGDPRPWSEHERGAWVTAIDFLNPSKYPPSLDFLLMTLGPALALLPLLARLRGSAAQALETLGRVPLFFYLLHIPLYHAVGILQAQLRFGASKVPAGEPVELLWILGLWLAVLAALWPACTRWREIKATRTEFWVRYL